MTTGISTASAIRSRRLTASASRSPDGSGVGGDTHFPGGLLFLDEGVDDAAVFAVYAADAALLLQLFRAWYMALSPIIMAG